MDADEIIRDPKSDRVDVVQHKELRLRQRRVQVRFVNVV